MELRNLPEQVAKNQEDIKQLKSGIRPKYTIDFSDLSTVITEENVGEYAIVTKDGVNKLYLIAKKANNEVIAKDLGQYPAVVKGEKGDTGSNGADGEVGSTIFGVSINPPTGARIGDFYIQKKIVDGATDYILNKLDINGIWRPQFSMRGPQGLPGVSENVIVPNPVGDPVDSADSLDINGIKYTLKDYRLSYATWDILDDILERVDVNSEADALILNTEGGVRIPRGGLQVQSGGIQVGIGNTSLKETSVTNLTFSTYIKASGSIARFNISSLSKIQDLDNNPLIVPNEEGTPTETLNQIKLGGTLYSIPSGGGSDIYEHRFQYASGHTFIFFNLYNNSQSNLGLEGIKTSLGLQGVICNGTFAKSGEQKHVVYIQASSSTGIWSVYYIDNEAGISSASVGVSQANLNETVIKIS